MLQRHFWIHFCSRLFTRVSFSHTNPALSSKTRLCFILNVMTLNATFFKLRWISNARNVCDYSYIRSWHVEVMSVFGDRELTETKKCFPCITLCISRDITYCCDYTVTPSWETLMSGELTKLTTLIYLLTSRNPVTSNRSKSSTLSASKSVQMSGFVLILRVITLCFYWYAIRRFNALCV